MLTYSIIRSPSFPKILNIGFSVWANKEPKDYLIVYPKATQEIKEITKSDTIVLHAIVDDVWPSIISARSYEEQRYISNLYITKLKEFGFDKVYLVSDFVKDFTLGAYLPYSNGVTVPEFWKLLPKSKKDTQPTLAEIIEFVWQVYVLGRAIDDFNLSGLLAGIRSEFFYLSAHKLLPPHDVYFSKTI